MSMSSCIKTGAWVAVCVITAGVCLAVPPQMVVEETVKDLGLVGQGQTIELVFALKNQGGEPMTVDVRPTCGCTVARWDKTIAAGETGSIHATLDTTGLRGIVKKSIMVITNDPETPTARLVIQAEVQPVLEILPRPLLRLHVTEGEVTSSSVVLAPVNAGQQEFEVTSIETDVPYVTAVAKKLEPAPGAEAGGRYEIAVSISEEAPAGFLAVPVTIFTTHPRAQKISFKVIGTVRRVSSS